MMAISLDIFSKSRTDAELDKLLTLQLTFQLCSRSNELAGKVMTQTLGHKLDISLSTVGLMACVRVCAIASAMGERCCEHFLDLLFPP